jgi:hypothetical protein
MVFSTVRNYLAERLERIQHEWKTFQKSGSSPQQTLDLTLDSDLKRYYDRFLPIFRPEEQNQIYQQQHDQIIETLEQKSGLQHFPAEFRLPLNLDDVPPNRIPPSGITILPWKYKTMRTVTATLEVPETGFNVHPKIQYLIDNLYPRYQQHITKYCRPLGTTDATVNDFFKPQAPSLPLDPERKDRILSLIIKKLDVTPFLPLHFVDTQYDKRPLATGTGYHNRRDYEINAHAKFSHPTEYADKHTSKGYYINAFLQHWRTLVHRIKEYGVPFNPFSSSLPLLEQTRDFILDYPTMLFTRNHISDRDGNLKQRPVYAADDGFLTLESMLTFPMHVLARKPTCAIMYGLETFRGANHLLDSIAKSFRSFFTIDWSAFDQRVPRIITDLFWTDFLEQLIVINQGYQPTFEYPSYPDLTPDNLFQRMSNLLHFLHTWYNNMVFITADGFAYVRQHAGVASGILNTQYLGSFANLFILIDALIEYGCSDSEIDELSMFVLGDDNSGFTHWSILRLEPFVSFLESYALQRYGMVLSKTKSLITILRNKIQTLSYECNFGMPTRPLPKLVAQLCYPEHGPIPKYMSARAIGIAYAACGMDPTFHNFCRDVYYTFLDDAAVNDPHTMQTILKYLPGQFKLADSYLEEINLTEFPTLHQVRSKVSTYQGSLAFRPKWNVAHFINTPDIVPLPAITMAEYRRSNKIPRRQIPTLF